MINLKLYLKIAKEAVFLASETLMEGFKKNPDLIVPSNSNDRAKIYSEYDKASNNILIENLSKMTFSFDNQNKVYIYSEESELSLVLQSEKRQITIKKVPSDTLVGVEDYTWVVDPICGSIPFARGIADFIISVALFKGNNLILGIVYDPVHKELFHALHGYGAYLNDNPISPSKVDNLDKAYISVEHRVFRKSNPKTIQYLSKKIQRLRVAGTCGLEMAYVACGRLDGMIKLSQPLYDYAAGYLLVKEANAVVTSVNGREVIKPSLNFQSTISFIASNGLIHEEFANITESL